MFSKTPHIKQALLATAVLLLLSFSVNKGGRTVKPFRWLEGSWGMKVKRGTIMESWKTNHDSSMRGSSKMIMLNGEEKLLEDLELVYSGGNYYYVSRVTGQNNDQPVKFRITSFGEKGFVAENQEHDFPKRITYDRVNNDSIHAFIDGGPQMPDKRSDFYYSRQKN